MIIMKKSSEESLKIKIRYSENPDSWNNFVNFVISFMLDSNIIGEIINNDGKYKNKQFQ